jgi:hypothetical protein
MQKSPSYSSPPPALGLNPQAIVPFSCRLPLSLVQGFLQAGSTTAYGKANLQALEATIEHHLPKHPEAFTQPGEQDVTALRLLRWAIVAVDADKQQALVEGVYWQYASYYR